MKRNTTKANEAAQMHCMQCGCEAELDKFGWGHPAKGENPGHRHCPTCHADTAAVGYGTLDSKGRTVDWFVREREHEADNGS